ncbi:MAG: hypothetical protein IE886_08665 [Campylobacterales bacterium]|nr:hypothetical protein [Campylobacterales bacterium]
MARAIPQPGGAGGRIPFRQLTAERASTLFRGINLFLLATITLMSINTLSKVS